ncbi:MAG TPA: hypothetical protein VLI04_08660 [Nocardioidaceae bacterium]|nr:hypothetical protein [Nocardioidaceae bacterium]
MRRALLLVLLGPLVPLLAVPPPALACSCAMFPPREHFQRADVVVAGELVSVEETPPKGGIISSGDPTTYTVSVMATYKGVPAAEVSFTSARDGASCGVEGLKRGRDVYFLHDGDDGYTANLCNGTGTVPEERIAAIAGGPLEEAGPVSTVIDSDEPAQTAYPWLLPSAGALVALGAGLLILRRRRGAKA